jgi:hypothetical protein
MRLARGLMVVAGYAFFGWAYVAANSVTHPATLRLQLTHLSAWPKEGSFGLACFVVSVVCFFLSQLTMGADR